MSSIGRSHKMALETSLRLVEKHLRWMKGILEQDTEVQEAILYRTLYDIKSSEKPRMLKAVASMLEEIKRMKTEFELSTQEDAVGRHMLGSLTEVWVTLEELRPEALKGFGRLSETSKKQIEPHVLKLLQSYFELSEALQDSRGSEGNPEP